MMIISIPGRSASAQTSSTRYARVSEEEAGSDTAVAKSECLIVALSIMLDDTKYNYIPSTDIHTLITVIKKLCFVLKCSAIPTIWRWTQSLLSTVICDGFLLCSSIEMQRHDDFRNEHLVESKIFRKLLPES